MQVDAWAPFAEERNNLFKNEILRSIAAKHQKSAAQVILRWLVQRGIIALAKTTRKERMIVFAFLWGCSACGDNRSLEDESYLTPIPEATITAYREDMPITNKLDAVIVAQRYIGTMRLEFADGLAVVSVEELTLDKAHQRVRDPQPGDYHYEDRPGNTRVWLVVLEGNYRIVPPIPDTTPEAYGRGCAYAIVDENGICEMGTIACPE